MRVREESVLFLSNKRLKRNAIFFAGVGGCFAHSHDAEMAADFFRLGVAVDFFGLGILFYLKRVYGKKKKIIIYQ